MTGWPGIAETVRASALARGVVIIGGGQAGGRAAEALRRNGFDAPITLIGDEALLPYERPSLSKDMLLQLDVEKIEWVQTADFYREWNITLRLGVAVVRIDRTACCVALADGSCIDYGALIVATGARVRRLAVPGAEHVLYVRTLEDSRALRTRLQSGSHVVIIGAGFIGLEVAAAARLRGADVTVLEVGAVPLGRVVPAVVGEAYRALHEAHGVVFRFGAMPMAVHRLGQGFEVTLDSGERLKADTIVAGIGVVPNSELAAEAGLAVDRGIVTDEFAATSDPFIFCIGDVALHFAPLLGRPILLESWQNAQNQAISVAHNLVAGATARAHADLPWFWSDQYDYNLQMFGLTVQGGEIILRGVIGAPGWIVLQVLNGKLVCAIGVNAARELRAARELMVMRTIVDIEELSRADMPLTTLWKREKAAQAALVSRVT